MNRRVFLKGATAATFLPSAFLTRALDRPKVIIVGGGLAGLSCAYELRKSGHDVTVLEGQGRPGGRVQTLREGLYPGLTAETGATRIPDKHHYTLSYVQEFGLPLEPFHQGNLDDVVHLSGQNYVARPGNEPNWPLQLSAEERRLGRSGLGKRYLADPLKLAEGNEDSPNVPESILAQDHATLYEYLKGKGLSSDAIKLLTIGGDSSLNVGLLLLVELNEQVNRGYFHIRGGNDQLPASIAKQLGESVRYGCRVTGIGQDDRSAWAVIENAEGHETIRGDYVVSALPFSVARNLFADARLSSEKESAIRELKYFPVDKIFLQMKRQFWKDDHKSGFANTDLLSERFWALGPDSADDRGLLLSYVIGGKAAQLDQMSVDGRAEQTLADAERVFPGARENFEGYRAKSWGEDPWQKGGLSDFEPGQLKLIPVNAQREGRIFFAGEHTSRWNGWMQGAIESAQRVAREIQTAS